MGTPLTKEHVTHRIREHISRRVESSSYDIQSLRDILVEMKAGGYSPDDAIAVLNEVRSEFSGTQEEDYVLEMLDVATCFCSPYMRVW